MAPSTASDRVHSKAVPDLIAKLVAERREMLVLLARLAELKPLVPDPKVRRLLQRFCQVLVDYVAFGHFELYQSLEDRAGDSRRCREIRRIGRTLYPGIAETTEAAIAFNDRYGGTASDGGLAELDQELSELGEWIATRIELEDRFIAAVRRPRLSVVRNPA